MLEINDIYLFKKYFYYGFEMQAYIKVKRAQNIFYANPLFWM